MPGHIPQCTGSAILFSFGNFIGLVVSLFVFAATFLNKHKQSLNARLFRKIAIVFLALASIGLGTGIYLTSLTFPRFGYVKGYEGNRVDQGYSGNQMHPDGTFLCPNIHCQIYDDPDNVLDKCFSFFHFLVMAEFSLVLASTLACYLIHRRRNIKMAGHLRT